jgi:hypothetical protein
VELTFDGRVRLT